MKKIKLKFIIEAVAMMLWMTSLLWIDALYGWQLAVPIMLFGGAVVLLIVIGLMGEKDGQD